MYGDRGREAAGARPPEPTLASRCSGPGLSACWTEGATPTPPVVPFAAPGAVDAARLDVVRLLAASGPTLALAALALAVLPFQVLAATAADAVPTDRGAVPRDCGALAGRLPIDLALETPWPPVLHAALPLGLGKAQQLPALVIVGVGAAGTDAAWDTAIAPCTLR